MNWGLFCLYLLYGWACACAGAAAGWVARAHKLRDNYERRHGLVD